MDQVVKDIADLIKLKQDKAAALLAELNKSLLIQTIWPEAFEDHKPVYTGGMKKMLPYPSREQGMVYFYFRKDDGTQRFLSRDEFEIFKPGETIHPDYRQSET